MENLNDIQQIWKSVQTGHLPTAHDMMQTAKQFRDKGLTRKKILITAGIFLAAYMMVLMLMYHSSLVSTRIGEILILCGALILAGTNIQSIGRFYHFDNYSNKEFIHFLEKTRQNQIRYYRKTQVTGLTVCSAGLIFYVYELVYHDRLLLIGVYSAVLIYLLFVWFVMRPRTFKKEQEKLRATMERLERIQKQF
ncbi:MAG: hypothetical protein M3N30_04700 [Bacteroidota bacterium]|nr:hypothetical protein [Bacteroidota bacterium]